MVEKWDSLKLRVRLERAKLVRAEEVVVVVVVVELLKLKSRSVSEGNREWSSFIIDGRGIIIGSLRLLGGVGEGLDVVFIKKTLMRERGRWVGSKV